MSTVASALSIAGSRTSGAPVRTQNGKRFCENPLILDQMLANISDCLTEALVINRTRCSLIKHF